jgi:hypothetical protein
MITDKAAAAAASAKTKDQEESREELLKRVREAEAKRTDGKIAWTKRGVTVRRLPSDTKDMLKDKWTKVV